MARKKSSGLGPFLIIILLALGLAATNPNKEQFRSVMRDQHKLKLTLASALPMHRSNYILFSKFEIKYGIGKTICYGAAAYVFVCPTKPKASHESEISTEAAPTNNGN